MADLWAALCLVAVLEGLFLFAAPGAWKRAAEQLQDLLDAIAALPQDVRARVQAASINPSGLIEFSLDSATIKWGTSTENEAKARIITVLLTQPATTYDVTVPGAPVTY